MQRGHQNTAALIQKVLKDTSELISFIQEEKDEFSKQQQNETMDHINSSCYMSNSLVPTKQKVLKSQVAQVGKTHRVKLRVGTQPLETLNSSDAGRYLGVQSNNPQ